MLVQLLSLCSFAIVVAKKGGRKPKKDEGRQVSKLSLKSGAASTHVIIRADKSTIEHLETAAAEKKMKQFK